MPRGGGFWWTPTTMKAARRPARHSGHPPPGCPLELTPAGGDAPASPVTYHGRIPRLPQTHRVENVTIPAARSLLSRTMREGRPCASRRHSRRKNKQVGQRPPGSPPRFPPGEKSAAGATIARRPPRQGRSLWLGWQVERPTATRMRPPCPVSTPTTGRSAPPT